MMDRRLDTVDAARGAAVIVMLVYHLLFDLVVFCGAPERLCVSPFWSFIQALFAGVFFFVSGLCAYASKRLLKRGLLLIALALAVSLASALFGMPVRFGALHFLGCAMIIYRFTRGLWDRLPERPAPVIYVILTAASAAAVSRRVNADFLWMIGLRTESFFSADYYPLLPWLFVFLCGTWAGRMAAERKFAQWFYDAEIPVLPFLGRHSLIIYLVHQPAYLGILALLGYM